MYGIGGAIGSAQTRGVRKHGVRDSIIYEAEGGFGPSGPFWLPSARRMDMVARAYCTRNVRGYSVRLKNSLAAVAAIILIAVVSAVAAACLPDNPYQRFQLLHGTDYENLSWIYERIHYDPKPVDVAIIGPSKTLLGVSAYEVEQRLSVSGKGANVANLSIVADGRNLQSVIVHELYKTKSPRILVISVDEKPHPWGHPAFKYVAPAKEIAFPPSPFLHNYVYDLSYLPFRQIELFAAYLLPSVLGLARDFDPVHYSTTRSDFTTSFYGAEGKFVDMDRKVPEAELVTEHKIRLWNRRGSIVPRALSDVVESDDRLYLDQIAREAAAHRTKLVFVYLPIFAGELDVGSRTYYGRYGTILDDGDLATQHSLFSHWAHLNHSGAMIVSDRIADAIAPLL